MTDIESLCRLTEAVEAAGADIAPTYLDTFRKNRKKSKRKS